jgi:hypothetical protein
MTFQLFSTKTSHILPRYKDNPYGPLRKRCTRNHAAAVCVRFEPDGRSTDTQPWVKRLRLEMRRYSLVLVIFRFRAKSFAKLGLTQKGYIRISQAPGLL